VGTFLVGLIEAMNRYQSQNHLESNKLLGKLSIEIAI
jgi:hypothetical protein